jgi:hypothetical protein
MTICEWKTVVEGTEPVALIVSAIFWFRFAWVGRGSFLQTSIGNFENILKMQTHSNAIAAITAGIAAVLLAPSRASAMYSSSKATCATKKRRPTPSQRPFTASTGSTGWPPMPAIRAADARLSSSMERLWSKMLPTPARCQEWCCAVVPMAKSVRI